MSAAPVGSASGMARGSAAELAEQYADGTRGELTLVIEGQRESDTVIDPDSLDEAIVEGLQTSSPRDLARRLAGETGVPKRTVYARIQQLTKSDP